MIPKVTRALDMAKFLYAQRRGRLTVPDRPHFDDASTEWFLRRLAQSRLYLEFGSGGSTVAATAQGIPTISVESDRFFARAVRRRVTDAAPLRMLPVDVGLTIEWGYPLFHKPTAARRQKWRRYIERPYEVIERGTDGFPDLVLVDGRFRRACALQTAQQANAAGSPVTLCVDDYGDRPYLAAIEPFLGRPALHGRMAVFEIAAGGVPVPEAAIEEAIGDCR